MPRRSREQVAEETALCYELRLKGHTLREIAKLVGISHPTVERRLKTYLEQRVSPHAEEYRALIIDRAERLLLQCDTGVRAGDPKMIAVAKGILSDLFRYNGLEMINIQVNDITSRKDAPADELIEFYENLLGLNQEENTHA